MKNEISESEIAAIKDWVLSKQGKNQEISIIFLSGSYVDNTYTEESDLDINVITAEDWKIPTNKFYLRDQIIDVGLTPWNKLESYFADRNDDIITMIASGLTKSIILYSKNQTEKHRFEALVDSLIRGKIDHEKIKSQLLNFSLFQANMWRIYQSIKSESPEEARKQIWSVINFLFVRLAQINNINFTKSGIQFIHDLDDHKYSIPNSRDKVEKIIFCENLETGLQALADLTSEFQSKIQEFYADKPEGPEIGDMNEENYFSLMNWINKAKKSVNNDDKLSLHFNLTKFVEYLGYAFDSHEYSRFQELLTDINNLLDEISQPEVFIERIRFREEIDKYEHVVNEIAIEADIEIKRIEDTSQLTAL